MHPFLQLLKTNFPDGNVDEQLHAIVEHPIRISYSVPVKEGLLSTVYIYKEKNTIPILYYRNDCIVLKCFSKDGGYVNHVPVSFMLFDNYLRIIT
jgi:hypothetical protein